MRGRIICLEGCSAVGKTTLADALATQFGAAVIPELDASDAPPPASAEPWFTHRHAERFRLAQAAALENRLVVLDTDVLKGLWYNWMHADEGWPDVAVVGRHYRAAVAAKELAFPDAYVYLEATASELEARRAHDATRSRRSFAKHLRTRDLQRLYFAALQAIAPDRVVVLPTTSRAGLPVQVIEIAEALPAEPPDSAALLDQMIEWVERRVGG